LQSGFVSGRFAASFLCFLQSKKHCLLMPQADLFWTFSGNEESRYLCADLLDKPIKCVGVVFVANFNDSIKKKTGRLARFLCQKQLLKAIYYFIDVR
jgi:hypothetical protein